MGWTEWGELASAQPQFTVIGEAGARGVNEAATGTEATLILPDHGTMQARMMDVLPPALS